MNNSILTTKINIPPLRYNIVKRARLIKKLNNGLNSGARLTLVSAPAGYGKTTVIIDWIKEIDNLCAWIALDEHDNDPMRFFKYLIASLKLYDGSIGKTVESLLAAPNLPPISALVSELVNDIALSSRNYIIVLEDYHTINKQQIHDTVQQLIYYQPLNLHIVIVTREDPPIPISRLRVRGQLNEIRCEDLKFSIEEIVDFCDRTMNLELDLKHAEVLENKTEGWIAGIQLAGLSLQGREEKYAVDFIKDFNGNQRYVIDYLIDEVLNRIDEDMRLYLCQISILDRFTSSLCDAVTGRTDSKELLNRLDKSNLFILPLDEQRQWYRFHHLFMDILQTELDRRSSLQLREKAAFWMWSNGHRKAI